MLQPLSNGELRIAPLDVGFEVGSHAGHHLQVAGNGSPNPLGERLPLREQPETII